MRSAHQIRARIGDAGATRIRHKPDILARERGSEHLGNGRVRRMPVERHDVDDLQRPLRMQRLEELSSGLRRFDDIVFKAARNVDRALG